MIKTLNMSIQHNCLRPLGLGHLELKGQATRTAVRKQERHVLIR